MLVLLLVLLVLVLVLVLTVPRPPPRLLKVTVRGNPKKLEAGRDAAAVKDEAKIVAVLRPRIIPV